MKRRRVRSLSIRMVADGSTESGGSDGELFVVLTDDGIEIAYAYYEELFLGLEQLFNGNDGTPHEIPLSESKQDAEYEINKAIALRDGGFIWDVDPPDYQNLEKEKK